MKNKWFLWLVAILIGAALAFSPVTFAAEKGEKAEKKEGVKEKKEELREKIKEKREERKEKRKETKEKMKEKREKMKEKMKEHKEEMKEKMKEKHEEMKEKMQENLAGILNIPQSAVNIKAKTNEGLDSIGKRAGVAAYAVAALT